MLKLRKRLEALVEIYESEKLYVQDLIIWGVEFRKYLFQSEALTIEKKHSLSSTLFINLDAIIGLHEQIIKEMNRRNLKLKKIKDYQINDDEPGIIVNDETAKVFKDLEYHSVFCRVLNRFSIYKYYVSRLPTVEFNLDKECSQNIAFSRELSSFFTNRNIELGPKHFIYRANQKLARYSILWKALLHYEENEEYIAGIKETSEKLKEIALNVDQTYGAINASYKIFRFNSELHYSEFIKQRIPLNLFQKKRKILKEGDVIVNNKNIKEPKELRFILLDTVILLCDVVRQENIEVKYIVSEPMPLYKYTVTDKAINFSIREESLRKMQKLFILERGGTDILVLFFRDINSRKMYFEAINSAIMDQRDSLDANIKMSAIMEGTNFKLLCCATRDRSFYEKNENLDLVEKLELYEHEDDESRRKNFSSHEMSISHERQKIESNKTEKFKQDSMTNFEKSVVKIIKKSDTETDEKKQNHSIFTDESSNDELCECEFHKNKHENQLQEQSSIKHVKHGRNLRYATQKNPHMVSDESEESSSKSKSEKDDNNNDDSKSITEDASHNESNETERNTKKSFLNRFFGRENDNRKTKSFRIQKGDFREKFNKDEQFLLFGTNEGLFVKQGDSIECIFDYSVRKVIYDVSNKIILFLEEKKIKCASFVPGQKSLETKTIADNTTNFFYGNTLNKPTIATLSVSNSSTTTISLFRISIYADTFSVDMDRKLFVGCLVFDISFFETKLVIACRDFEMVDSDTLKTQELVDPLDLCVPFYFRELNNITALSVFTISENIFLVCYDSMGFYIDAFGRTIKQNIIFVWFFEPLQFKIYKNFISCLGKTDLAIWSLETGDVVFNTKIKDCSFVEGSTSFLLYDAHNLYKIIID